MGSDPKKEHHEEPEQQQEHDEKKMALAEDHQGEQAKEEAVGVRAEYNYMKREKEVDHEVSPSVQQGALLMAEDEDEMAAEIEAGLIFSDEAFPSLPDFPCLSSPSNAACPSSSSSCSASSASSASWAIEQQHAMVPLAPSPAVGDVSMSIPSPTSDGNQTLQALDSDCSMDLLAEMDLLGPTDDTSWEPSSLFPDDMKENDNNTGGGEHVTCLDEHQHRQQQQLLQQHQQQQLQYLTLEEGLGAAGQGGGCTSEELAMVFLEWLRNNKEAISPQDLRSIRLRRSTIECAARNLGGSKEGMKKLLKLILAWVQSHHLQKKRRPNPLAGGNVLGAGDLQEEVSITTTKYRHHQASIRPPNPPPNLLHVSPAITGVPPCTGANPNPCPSFMPVNDPGYGFPACSSWAPPVDAAAVPSFPPAPMSCGGDALYSPGATAAPMQPFSPPSTFHAVEPICSWPPPLAPQYPAFPTAPPGQLPSPYPPAGLPGHYRAMEQLFHQGPGEPLVRLAASATKEARKKRMARQRRFSSLHHHHQQRSQQDQLSPHQQQQQIQLQQCASGLPGEALCSQMNSDGNWGVWPSTSASPHQVAMLGEANTAAMQQQRQHNFPAGSAPPERRQGWKSEKNLRFLLQKVLKQSDVGSLGRIVLPKKEAEIHLPELDARDGISISMEDIGTSRTWNMRYRFWPNNKSRMYLLENTGDFVRSNGLQEGDFIVIYTDVKCGKYMIRGVKVRQPADSKVDGRNAGKHTVLQKNGHAGTSNTENNTTANSSSSHEKKESINDKKETKGLSGREREAIT